MQRQIKMTDKQKTMANLRMVLEELPKLAEKIPSIRDEFNMTYYGCYDQIRIDLLHNCATYGCLAGNIARLFPAKNEYFDENSCFSYNYFIKSEFPMLILENWLGLNSNWSFLFSPLWRGVQPTFDQAMKRLEYFIKCDGELPEWDYQTEDFV